VALGVPANDRMDDLVEKVTELGVAHIQPLLCERSVLRLSGERALKRVAHWCAVAVAASEQSGRTRVPQIGAVLPLADWLASLPAPAADGRRYLLSLRDTAPFRAEAAGAAIVLSGPEGGLTEAEEAAARAAGFAGVSLGARTLRADTAPLAALAAIALAGIPPG
jgi:16S rRNA (uracil1498-N3)-methyltransferase